MARLFFSYSHKDAGLRDELEVHLSMLQRQGLIETWHDRRIAAGDELDKVIDSELESADIILLLVSPDFLASQYCYGVEMLRAMERHDAGEARVIPVILRPCDWSPAPFSKLLATPTDGKAITKWPDRDDAFLDVVKSIRAALTASPAEAAPSRPAEPATDTSRTPRTDKPRSGNMRIAKTFTDRDRDRFLHDAFEYLAKFFDNSLIELAERNSELETSFRRLDANRFTGTIYKNGKKSAACTIFLGSLTGERALYYWGNDTEPERTYNESLFVDADDQALFLKTLGVHFLGGTLMFTDEDQREPQKLTLEGGAEHFWSMLMERVQ